MAIILKYMEVIMDNFVTRYDVEKTMYQKFAAAAEQRGNNPCFYYYNNTVSFAKAKEMEGATAN